MLIGVKGLNFQSCSVYYIYDWIKYGPDVLDRSLSAHIRDMSMYIKHRYNHFMVVSNASRSPEPSE